MASVEDQLKNARTLEDIINILAILFNNMNSISRVYYDLFVNPIPMVVPVTLYDDNGLLTTKDIPNIASYRTSVLLVEGDPNGVQEASVGAFCIDTTTGDLYYKASGDNSSSGWKRVYSNNQDNFLTPTGNGSGLTNLDVSNATAGPLATLYGGTGVNADSNFTGLVRANGINPFTQAVPNEDYVSPANMVGIVSHYAGDVNMASSNAETTVNGGWLVCNGAEVSISKYTRLFNKIGTKYGGNGTTTFKVPDLIGRYVKGAATSGASGDAQVGGHTHALSGSTDAENEHTHDRGTYDICGIAGTSWMSNKNLQSPAYQFKGCFFKIPSNSSPKITKEDGNKFRYEVSGGKTITQSSSAVYYGVNDDSTSKNDPGMGFQASLNWTGKSGTVSHSHSLSGETDNNAKNVENDVAHVEMIPVIKF